MEIAAPDALIGPCAGFRVLDFSTMISGPLAGQNLGDLGADVIKIESTFGDTARWVGPPERAGLNGFYSQLNRNKRCIAIDLKTAEGREIAQALASTADVVLENFRPGVADRLGIGYDELSRGNPGLVYVSVSGFGPDGPYAKQPVYDLVIQGMSGLMPVQGGAGQPPQMLKSVAADKTSAITAASCALAALLARERNNGQGQHVHVPMINAYAQFALTDLLTPETFIPKPEWDGYDPDLYRTWRCADGYLVGTVIEEKQYQNLCRCLGREDLVMDERFLNIANRMRNLKEMNDLLEPEFRKQPWRELLENLRRHQVPFGPVYDIADFIDDPQVKHNRTVFEAQEPAAGTMRYLRHPGVYEKTPATMRRHPPRLGEHTDEILGAAGFTQAQITQWREAGVIG